MSELFVEGNLRFEFGARWTKVFRWDRHPVHLGGMSHAHEGKAVDFIGILEGTLPFFIEVKDYRGRTRADEKGPLERELELKLRSTAAALLGARCREEQDQECIHVHEVLIESRKPQLVLWLEEDRPDRTPGPTATRHRQTRAGTLTSKIKQSVRWIDVSTFVTSVSDDYQTVVPDVVVTSLPLERRKKAEKVVERLKQRGIKVPERLTWRILDCLDEAELNVLYDRAAVVHDPWRLFRSRT